MPFFRPSSSPCPTAGRPASGSTGASTLAIRRYTSEHAVEWDEFVRRAPRGTICHLSGWARVVERTWGYRPYHLYARRGGTIAGILPLFHVPSRWFGCMLVSTPVGIYGGALAEDPSVGRALIGEAKRLASDLGVEYLELREPSESEEAAGDPELRLKSLYVTFGRSLPSDGDELLRSYPGSVRNMVRRGMKHGLSAELGGLELLGEFYEVFAANMRDLGTPALPRRLFAEFLREFPNACDILVVRRGGRPAGATMNFYFRDVVLPHYGCAYREMHSTGVSNFMYWELMRRATGRGCRYFDFGRSKVGTGSWAFKRHWKMHERALPYRYFLVRAKRMPNLSPTNPRFRLMIAVWKRLPVGMTKLVGPVVVKHFP